MSDVSLTFRLLQAAQGRSTIDLYEQRLRSQWLGRDEVRARQLAALQALIRHAAAHVPRVSAMFRERGFDPAAIRSFDDYARLVPTLDKDELRRDLAGLRADDADRTLIVHRTGGSSGQPVELPRDRRSVSSFWADYLMTRSWWGVRMGEPEARIWGHYVQPPNRRAWVTMHARDLLRRRLLNHVLLSAYDLTEASMERFVRQVARARPTSLYGYVSALETLARFLQSRGLELRLAGSAVAITTAEPLSATSRRLLRATFGRPVANEYGCCEAGLLAFDCPAGRLHLLEESNLVEVVDEKGRSLEEGVGEVVITPLVNRATPLLRYQLGDVARLSTESCPCGRGSRVLESVEGRVWSLLRTADGRIIYPGIVDKIIFTLLPDIERYQAIQDALDHLTVRIVSHRPIDADRLGALAAELAAGLGASTRVDIELVRTIEPELSGKYVFIKSLVPPE